VSWGMINGWREDFNEGPYDYLAVRDGWEIFQQSWRDKFRLKSPEGIVSLHNTEKEAKEYAYEGGCSRPEEKVNT